MKRLFYSFWRKKYKKKSYQPNADSKLYYLSKEVNELRESYYELNDKIRDLAKVNHLKWIEGYVPDVKEWEKK